METRRRDERRRRYRLIKGGLSYALFVFVLFYILIYIVFYVFRMYGYSGGIYRIYPFPSGGSHAQSLGGSA